MTGTIDIEQNYVNNVYSKLASHATENFFETAHQRTWPNVSKFVQNMDKGSVILEIGKHTTYYSNTYSMYFNNKTL